MNKKEDEIGKVYVTNDYDMFKVMAGNRNVNPKRVAKIRTSIERNGFRMCPIVVNSKYEVVDGQGRLAALRDLQLPVCYVIDEGADIEVCRALNINQANWKIIDYVRSFASDPNKKDYVSLLRFCEDYDTLPIRVKISACAGRGTVCTRYDRTQKCIVGGDFKFLYTESDRAKELDYLTKFKPAFSNVRGSVEFYYQSIMWIVRNLVIDNERLLDKVLDLRERLAGAVNVNTCMTSLSDIYNNRIRGEHIYFDHEYKVRVTDATGRDYSK